MMNSWSRQSLGFSRFNGFVSIIPAFLAACFLFVLQPSAVRAAPAAQEILLGQLAGWEVAGLNALGITGVTKGQDFTAGTATVSGVRFQIVVFKAPHAHQNSVAFLTDALKLSSLVAAARGTPLDDLELQKPAFIVVGRDDAGKGIALPSPVASHLGVRTLDLKTGLNLAGTVTLTGAAGELMGYVGLVKTGLRLAGTLHPSVLSGKPSAGQLADAFVSQVDLSIPVNALTPHWKPGFVAFTPSALMVKGVAVQGNRHELAFGILTGIRIALGSRALTFDEASVSWDPKTRGVTIRSRSIKPDAGLMALPGKTAEIDSLSFAATFADNARTITLPGTYKVGGQPGNFTATLTGGAQASYAITMDGTVSLSHLTGWDLPGIGDVTVSNVAIGNDYTVGKLTIGKLPVTVAIFKAAHQTKSNAAFLFDNLKLSDLVAAARNTPLDDLQLTKPAFVVAPAENAAKAVVLPGPVADHLGENALDLKAGANLSASVTVAGTVGDLMGYMGLVKTGLRLAGTLDPRVLSGKLSAGQLEDAFVSQLDLSIPINALAPHWKPGFLSFLPDVLSIKGVPVQGGRHELAFGIDTQIKIILGDRSVTFDDASVSWDPKTRGVTVASGAVKPDAGLLTLPGKTAEIDSLSFTATFADNAATITLPGTYKVGSQPGKFTATLSGGARATYAISMDGTVSLSHLTGWDLPGIGDVAVSDVAIGNDYTTGKLTIGKLAVDLAVFKAAQQKKFNAALMFDDLKLSDLVAAARNTPLDDLQLSKPAFVVVPAENAAKAVGLPDPVASHLGLKTLDIKAGANLSAKATASGTVGDLLALLGAAKQGLALAGGIDPSVLKGGNVGGQLAQAFLDALDLQIPLGSMTVPGLPNFLRTSGAVLRIKGEKQGISAAVNTAVTVTLKGSSLEFDSFVKLGTAGGQKFAVISGAYPHTWDKPFGVPWLSIGNVTLDATLGGTKTLAVSGTTDLGHIKGLKVTADLMTKGGQIDDIGIALTGADIPLSVLPGLQAIPNSGRFALRDVVVSSQAVAATTKTDLKIFDGLRTVVFESAGKWSLAMLHENLSLSSLVPLTGPAKSMLEPLALKKAAVVISDGGINGRVADLPPPARDLMQQIYGTTDRQVTLISGLNLVSEIDLGKVGAGLSKLNRSGVKPVFAGGIGGIFGGPPTIDLAAAIPPIDFPKSLSFLDPPKNVQTAFFIRFQDATEAAVGIELSTRLDVKTKHSRVQFETDIAFQADTQGGFAIDVQGKTDSPWRDAMGIKGLTMKTGTRIEVKATDTSEVTVTFVGLSDVGTKEVKLIGSAGVLAAEGVLDKVAFEGAISELGLADFVALADAVVLAGGGKLPAPNFPSAELKNVDIAFASPGASVPEMGISDGGIRLAGELWFLVKGRSLGQFKGQVDGNGLEMAGDIANFDVGPISMRGNSLDVKAVAFPPQAYFKIRGDGRLFGKGLDFELSAATDHIEMATDLDLGSLLKFDFKALAEAPAVGFTAADLAKADLGLHAQLKADLGAWLRSDGVKAVTGALGDAAGALKQADADLKKAQAAVDSLTKQIDDMRAQVKKERAAASKSLTDAQKDVDRFAKQVSDLAGDVRSAEGHIHKCDYTESVCVLRNWFKHNKCVKHASVPDVKRNAECVRDNVKYGAIVAEEVGAKKTAEAAKAAADAVLDNIKKGIKSLDVDADPRVAALIASRVTADGALKVAEDATKGLGDAAKLVENAIKAAAAPGVLAIKNALIQGSLKGAIAGKPVVIGLELEVLRNTETLGMAISLTDPVFTASQFEEIAFLLAWKGLDADKKVPKLVVSTIHDLYVAKHDKVKAELAKALKANGLEE
jgi:hypothetical protein